MIHRLREAVFACITTVTFLEHWVASFRADTYSVSIEHGSLEGRHTTQTPSIRQMTPGAIGKGTLFRQTVGSDISLQEATIEVTEYAWPGVFSLTETSEVGTTQTRLILETAPDGTTLTWITDVQFSGWLLRILAYVFFLQARMRNASSMGRLKHT